MNEKQQIEEIEEVLINKSSYTNRHCDDCAHWFGSFCGAPISCEAEALYNAGFRKVPDGAVILTPEERDEEMKARNGKLEELDAEIDRLERVVAQQSDTCWSCKTTQINAVKEFAEKVKAHAERCYEWNIAKIVSVEICNVLKEYEDNG